MEEKIIDKGNLNETTTQVTVQTVKSDTEFKPVTSIQNNTSGEVMAVLAYISFTILLYVLILLVWRKIVKLEKKVDELIKISSEKEIPK